MSRQQIANFSAFLMNWISDSANHEAVSHAVALAIKSYNDEREAPQAALSELRYDFRVAADADVCPFERFSKDDFFKLCDLLKLHDGTLPQAEKLVQRILGVQNEYNRMLKLIATVKSFENVNIVQCEYWHKIEFSMQEIELMKKLLPGSEASDLWAKLPSASTEQEEISLQYFLERVKTIADQVGTVTKTVAEAARSRAMDLRSENSAASFLNSSLASPNSKDFLLSIDSRIGSWEVAGAGFFSGRTSLKTRMIHAVCDAFYRSRTPQDTLQKEVDDGFLEISEQALKLRESARAARLPNVATYDAQEARVLQLYVENTISPLTKTGQALQIYQSLLAIDAAAKMARLSAASVVELRGDTGLQRSVAKSAPLVVDDSSGKCSAALAPAPHLPQNAPFRHQHAGDDDNDDYDQDDNRSKACFK